MDPTKDVLINVLEASFLLLTEGKLSPLHSYDWLNVFDSDDLSEFIRELMEAYRNQNTIGSIVYEWKQSAIAISSVELEEAFNSETDEVELSKPSYWDL